MPTYHLRPRTQCMLPGTPADVVERLRQMTRRNNPSDLKLRGSVDELLLRFPSHTSHAWTPQVRISLVEQAAGGTLLRAVIGPERRVWRWFIGVLTALSTLGAMGLVVGFAQWSMGKAPWGFYLAVIGLVGGLLLYFVSAEAGRRTREQAEVLRDFLDQALGRSCFLPDRHAQPASGLLGDMA